MLDSAGCVADRSELHQCLFATRVYFCIHQYSPMHRVFHHICTGLDESVELQQLTVTSLPCRERYRDGGYCHDMAA